MTTRIESTTLVKVLDANGCACHGGTGQWNLPKDGQPGEWMPPLQNVQLCAVGYHAVTVAQVIPWLHESLWLVEVRGQSRKDDEKSVFSEARLLSRIETWNDRTARLFAADCAERVLSIFEKNRPGDDRPRAAIKAARDYANHLTYTAARDAARAAAWDAAWDAARAAARAAAWAAARDAARAAAWDAAGDAARAAARAAAWAAAGAAAWDAAWDAAGDAAWDAAGDAAWDAAWDAAGDAEHTWQISRLIAYLNGAELMG